jgi:hypothetical protein
MQEIINEQAENLLAELTESMVHYNENENHELAEHFEQLVAETQIIVNEHFGE